MTTTRPAATGKTRKTDAISRFFDAYARDDVRGMGEVMSPAIEWTIPGRNPLSGTKHGIEEVAAFFTELGKAGFEAEPIFLEASEEYVVDIHRGWTTRGAGRVDTLWALVWHFNNEGLIDRVINLSADQHQMDELVWNNYALAPLPRRLADGVT